MNLRRWTAYVSRRSASAYLGLVQGFIIYIHNGVGWCRSTLCKAANVLLRERLYHGVSVRRWTVGHILGFCLNHVPSPKPSGQRSVFLFTAPTTWNELPHSLSWATLSHQQPSRTSPKTPSCSPSSLFIYSCLFVCLFHCLTSS